MNENRFTGKAEYYAKYRPSYPVVVVEHLYEKTHAERVADIGAGTGKFTEMLMTKPWSVTAVEPNSDMRRELLRSVGGKAEIVAASAEDTGLPAHSFGLITAAQAFHWFDPEKFRDECRRLLTPDGMVAVLFNSKYQGDAAEERNRLFMKYSPEFAERGGRMGPVAADGDRFLRKEFFSAVDVFMMETQLPMTREIFIGDALSRSYSPRENDECFSDFVSELHLLFDKYHKYGKVTVSYTTICYTGSF